MNLGYCSQFSFSTTSAIYPDRDKLETINRYFYKNRSNLSRYSRKSTSIYEDRNILQCRLKCVAVMGLTNQGAISADLQVSHQACNVFDRGSIDNLGQQRHRLLELNIRLLFTYT